MKNNEFIPLLKNREMPQKHKNTKRHKKKYLDRFLQWA
jgi:hypothetical protein